MDMGLVDMGGWKGKSVHEFLGFLIHYWRPELLGFADSKQH